jgi:hypothetical protein
MRLYSRGVIEIDVSASISYEPNTGTVNVFLHGCSSEQQETIKSQLNEFSQLASHPLLLPSLLVEMKADILRRQEVRLWNQLIAVESLSGQTDLPAVNVPVSLPGANADFGLITLKALGVIQGATSVGDHAKALLQSIGEIQKCIAVITGCTEDTRGEYMKKSGTILSEKLGFLTQVTNMTLSSIEFIEKRGTAQQSAVSLT